VDCAAEVTGSPGPRAISRCGLTSRSGLRETIAWMEHETELLAPAAGAPHDRDA
jgi:hypothetical protein